MLSFQYLKYILSFVQDVFVFLRLPLFFFFKEKDENIFVMKSCFALTGLSKPELSNLALCYP